MLDGTASVAEVETVSQPPHASLHLGAGLGWRKAEVIAIERILITSGDMQRGELSQ